MENLKIEKNLLVVSAHFPSYKAKYAGHKTAFKILREYSEKFKKVDLIVVCNKDEVDLDSLSELKNVSIKLLIPLTKRKKLINALKSRRFFPLKVMNRFSEKVLSYIKNNINNYDALHFEFTHAAVYFPFIEKELRDSGINTSVSCHDILFQSVLRKQTKSIWKYLALSFEAFRTFEFEKELFYKIDKMMVHSLKDKELVVSLYAIPDSKIEVIHPPLSEFIHEAKSLRKKTEQEPGSLLFWGAMNRKENEEAVIEFIKLHKEFLIRNNLKLYVVGSSPSKRVKKLSSENIIITGYVENPAEYFAKCQLGIVPLLSGAGIKVKTLEMLECGMPVISTPIGAEGIENDNLYVCDIKDFPFYIKKLLNLH